MQFPDLPERESHLFLFHQGAHFLHTVRACAKGIAAMNKRHAAGQRLQVQCPVQRTVTATDNQNILVSKFFHTLDRIKHRGAFIFINTRNWWLFRSETATTRRNDNQC